MTTWETFYQVHADIDAQRGVPNEPETVRLRGGGYHQFKTKPRPEKPKVRSLAAHHPKPGEMCLKDWLTQKAQEDGICWATAFRRYRAGKYRIAKRVVNSRAIFVRESKPTK